MQTLLLVMMMTMLTPGSSLLVQLIQQILRTWPLLQQAQKTVKAQAQH
jgi:hypothetical protein